MSSSPATLTSNQGYATALAQQFAAVRRMTAQLAAPLSADDQMVQSMPEASPTKWHLAHTTWFFETFILISHTPGYKQFDPRFSFLFNSYYKQLEGHPNRATRGSFSRPTLAEVQQYRHHVDDAVLGFLDRGELEEPVARLLELGCHHEQQHQELIVTDIKHAFWTNPLHPAYVSAPAAATGSHTALSWANFPEGLYDIGHAGEQFAFDNESPRHRVYLQAFQLASRLVTNREYLEFIEDGGYRRPELWLSDGWDQVVANGWSAPLYWEKHGVEWSVFTCAGVREFESDEPVCHVSYYEADAYARWAGSRLPTEFEWEVAARQYDIRGNLLEQARFHPAPAEPSSGVHQLFGDVWEWTASPYVAYPGYRAAAGALGEYNGKFMCNQVVLRGGSCATPASHLRATYRNFFPPHARWQFMGIRLANDRN
jgi:ergothioneine biosynthesis protein EgtB